ncbi:MAG: copper resistance CopC/CopD family protein [Oryzihumus sp.]
MTGAPAPDGRPAAPRAQRWTALRRLLAAVLFAAGAALVAAVPASAHAQLEGSDPPAGVVLTSAPTHVTLVFGEPVEVADAGIQVYDDHLRRVDSGAVRPVDEQHNRITVALRPALARGTYTVSWHVSSADTHPVAGSFRFSVGAASTVTGAPPERGRNDLAGLLMGILRGVGYAGLALGPGMLLATLLLWPAGLQHRRHRRLLHGGLSLLLLSTVGGMLLQGVWASGRPLSALWSSPSTLDTHSRAFDMLYALRFYLLVAFGIALVSTLTFLPRPDVRRRRFFIVAVAGCTLALLVTWAMAGHAAVGDWNAVATVANVVHTLAMAVWLGGLVLLAVSLRGHEHRRELAEVLPAFSRLAFAAVALLAVTGTYMSVREVGSWNALVATTFGHTLLVKLAGVLVLLALGNLARRWVQRHLGPVGTDLPFVPAAPVLQAAGREGRRRHNPLPAPEQTSLPATGDLRRLRAGLWAEVGVGSGVLGLTAALVVIVPARQDYVAPLSRTVATPGMTVRVDVPNPRVGDATVHVTVRTPDGQALPVTGVSGSVTLRGAGLGPLPVRVRTAGGASRDGRLDGTVSFPVRGTWLVRLTVRTSPTDATALSVTVPVS